MRLTTSDLSSNPSLQNTDGVKALLDKLKSSQAWQQTIAASDPPTPPAPVPSESRGNSNTDIRPSVASLLAQLAEAGGGYPGPPPPSLAGPRPNEAATIQGTSPAPVVVPRQTSIGSDKHDLHAFSFQQTLSHLAQLSVKPGFIESIRRVRHHPGNQSASSLLNLEIRFKSNRAPSNPSCGTSGSPFRRSTRKRSRLP